MKQLSTIFLTDNSKGLKGVNPDAGDSGLNKEYAKSYINNSIPTEKSKETSTKHEIANNFLRSGLSVIPCDPKTKKPTIKWKGFQSNLMPDAKAFKWPGLAVICGNVSGNLECIDFDFKASWFDDWRALVENENPNILIKLFIQKTQSGGKHIVYRCTEPIPGNQKLASDKIQVDLSETYEKDGKRFFSFQGKELETHEVNGKLFVYPCFIETRSEGGYFLAAPTKGYSVQQGAFSNLPVLSAIERTILVSSAKALNRKPPEPERVTYQSGNGNQRPGDLYNEQAEILPLLLRHGWRHAGSKGNIDHFTRPGKDKGISASVFDGKILHVFSSNASPFESEKSYSPFSVYTLLEHSGDLISAVKAAAIFNIEKPNKSNNSQTENTEPVKTIGFQKFILNGTSKDMEAKMLADTYVIDQLAILGQSTVFYAPSNFGKTLIVFHYLIESIKSGNLTGKDVFFINADDTHAGLVFKLKLAEKYGFGMLCPGHHGFKSEMFTATLSEIVESGQARGKVIILDTLKKFTDIMNKAECKKFGTSIRDFVSQGGTVIMLAHTNKHRGGGGKLIYAGTADIVQDADCAYTIDKVNESETRRQIIFENNKNRGPVDLKAVYEYDHRQDTKYIDRLKSIRKVTPDEQKQAERKAWLRKKYIKNADAVRAIIESLKEGVDQKTTLIASACHKCDLSQSRVKRALREHTGKKVDDFEFWRTIQGDKNSKIYHLNFGYESLIFDDPNF